MNLLTEKLDKAKTICILGHTLPDGDCMGSSLALYNYILNKYGNEKKVRVYLTEFSKRFLILPGADKVSHDTNDAEKYDLCIVVDCGGLDRFKDYNRYFTEAKDSVNFDHHENNNLPSSVTICDPQCVATCELLAPYLEKEYVDRNVAMCLYTGLATDSGVFRYKSVTRKTMELAGNLIEYGFDFTHLLDVIVFDNTINQRLAQSLVFSRIKLYRKGTLSYSYFNDEDLAKFNITRTELDSMIVYIREIAGVEVAAFAYQIGNNIYKFSLRSKLDKYNLSDFAKSHEGGGHKLAAGCIYHGDIETVSNHFIKDMEEFLDGKKDL